MSESGVRLRSRPCVSGAGKLGSPRVTGTITHRNRAYAGRMTTSRGPVERATRAQLRRLGIGTAGSATAAACVVLAQQLDSPRGAAAAAVAARELRMSLLSLSAEAAARKPGYVNRTGLDDGQDPELAQLFEVLSAS